jgi:hypothetical protein
VELIPKKIKYLAFFRRNSGISFDEFCEHAAKGFDTERKWRHIQQKHVFYISRKNTSLNGSSQSYCFVWVYGFAWGTAKYLLDE